MRSCHLLFAAAFLLMPTTALAQAAPPAAPPAPPAADDASFDQLFAQGRKLMDVDHDYVQACPVFERAAKLRTSIGILLNLGDCYERLGRIATALTKFREAADAAHAASDPRETFANDRVSALGPRIPRLSLDTTKLAGAAGVELRLDGVPVEASHWGDAFPVDPGQHTVDVYAPGKKPWSHGMDVTTSTAIYVPALEDVGAAPVVPTGPAQPDQPPPASAGLGTQRTLAIVAAGVGVVGLGVGSAFGLVSLSDHNTAQAHCEAGGNPCSAQGVQAGKDAQSAGNLSTVAFIVGLVGAGAGVALWLTAPVDASRPGVALVPGAGAADAGLSLRGRW